MIKQVGKKWILYSKDGKKKLGTFDTKEEAEEREKEIKRIKAMNKNFQQFETSVNDDGSVNILKVPIFKLGKHKSIDFNKELADEIVANHKKLKEEDDYLSSVIIGHNDDGQAEEKTAEGFLDNLSIEDEVIYSDIIKVDADTFESSIKKKKYPHRSVEYNPKTKLFNTLALLGGTTPHHKLPIMEFEDSEDRIRLDFEESENKSNDLKAAIELEEKVSSFKTIWYKMQDFIHDVMFDKEKAESDKKTEVKNILNEGVELLGIEAKNFKEEEPMKLTDEQKQAVRDEDLAKFKEEHNGMTPQEIAAENQQLKDGQKQAAEQEHKKGITAFAQRAKDPKGLALAPAIVDEYIVPLMESLPQSDATIKFKEDDKETEIPQMQFFEKTVEVIVEKAQKNELQVPFDELTKEIEYDGVEGSWEAKLHEKASKAAKRAVEDGKYKSFDEAYEAIIFQLSEDSKAK